jgi:hypothetical protein
MQNTPTIRKGNRVETSGEGRTARWPHGTATVTMVRKNRVYVVWDGTHFEDEMEAREVRPITPAAHRHMYRDHSGRVIQGTKCYTDHN